VSLDHAAAIEMARAAIQKVYPDLASNERKVRLVAAVGWHETGYGSWWKQPGVGSNNMGAITAGSSWKGQTFAYQDSNPDQTYVTNFRKYATPQDGWDDLAKVALKTEAERAAITPQEWSQALYDAVYYTGTSKVPATNVSNHAKSMTAKLSHYESLFGPDGYPSGSETPTPTSSSGALAAAVVLALVAAAIKRAAIKRRRS
jgi:hypothetical protein